MRRPKKKRSRGKLPVSAISQKSRSRAVRREWGPRAGPAKRAAWGRRSSRMSEKAAVKPVANDMELATTRGLGKRPNKHKPPVSA